MLPKTESSTAPCSNISSNCVIWQGPDIPCIDLCTGDTISDVVAALAQQLCDLVIPEPNLNGLDLLCVLPQGQSQPDTVKDIIQLIVDYICDDEGQGEYELPTLLLPACLSPYEDPNGNTFTALPLDEYASLLANKICDILEAIDIINVTLGDHETRITILEDCVLPCTSGGGDPDVFSTCILQDQTIPASTLLLALEEAFCDLQDAVGAPPLVVAAVNQAGCITSSEPMLSSSGTYGGVPGWISTPTTLSHAVGNAWIVICDMHQAIKDIQLNCCPGACDDVVFAYTPSLVTNASGVPNGVEFDFSASSVPPRFNDCGGSTVIEIVDQNGVVANQTFTFVNYAGTSTPLLFNLSTTSLNVYNDLDVSIDFCITDGIDQCDETITSTVASELPCPTDMQVNDITEEQAVLTFTNVLGPSAIYTVNLTDLTDGTSSNVFTVTGLGSLASIELLSLEESTDYSVSLSLQVNGINQSCDTETFSTGASIPSCPTRRVVVQICNANSALDDNFNIILNGTLIGSVDLNSNAQVGSVFIADLDPTLSISSADFVCPLAGMVQFNFSGLLLQPVNTLQMVNTQNNGNGNFGSIGIRNYEIVTDPTTGSSSLANPCVIADLTYSMGSGEDASFTFNYDECCPGDEVPLTRQDPCKEYTVSTTSAESQPFSYTDCDGVEAGGSIGGSSGSDSETFCALEGSVNAGTNVLVENGDCTPSA